MDLLARLRAVVGEQSVLAGAGEADHLLHEPRGRYQGRALAAVFPKSTEEVSRVLAVCHAEGVGVTPQGGNTGLVGGQTPDLSGAQVLLSLAKLERIRDVDATSDTMTVEAGVTLAAAQAAARSCNRYFPLSLASEGSCTIGGNLATNAGGVHVIAYGSMRALTLGVEAVLADGRIFNGLSKLRKDNTGYDLTQLLVGSEGTLGVITAATLKLYPALRQRETAFVALRDATAALALLERAKAQLGSAIQAFELLPRIGVDLVLKHAVGARDPLAQAHAWYVLVEFATAGDIGLKDRVVEFLGDALGAGVAQDATLAESLAQGSAFWRLRESMSEVQGKEGGSIKHDVSLPLKDAPAFIEEAGRRVTQLVPGARPVPFGHLGDGNIHYNVSQPVGADKAAFLARWEEVNEVVHGVVAEHGGSISAEHGIGQAKRALLAKVKDPTALATMRAIKSALDPKGILNRGKLL